MSELLFKLRFLILTLIFSQELRKNLGGLYNKLMLNLIIVLFSIYINILTLTKLFNQLFTDVLSNPDLLLLRNDKNDVYIINMKTHFRETNSATGEYKYILPTFADNFISQIRIRKT